MTSGELIDALHKAGATLVVVDGKARVRGAKVADELLAALKANREGVIAEWHVRQAAALDRYGVVPSGEVHMFGRDQRLKAAEGASVIGYVLRQPHTVHAWMQSRANAYHVMGVPFPELELCACVDVLAWQRNRDGRQAVEWLMGIEECYENLPQRDAGAKDAEKPNNQTTEQKQP